MSQAHHIESHKKKTHDLISVVTIQRIGYMYNAIKHNKITTVNDLHLLHNAHNRSSTYNNVIIDLRKVNS